MNDNPTTGPAWKIIDVTDTTIFDPVQGISPGKRVSYLLFNGKRSFVDVPLDKFDAATVSQAIDDAASKVVEVMNLEGPTITTGITPPKLFEIPQ